MSQKLFDEEALFFDEEDTSAWTASTHNSSSVDQGSGIQDQLNNGRVVIRWPGITSGGAATIQVILADSVDDSTFADVWTSEAYSLANAVTAFGTEFAFDVPPLQMQRYIRLEIVVGTAALTGGTLTAGLVK